MTEGEAKGLIHQADKVISFDQSEAYILTNYWPIKGRQREHRLLWVQQALGRHQGRGRGGSDKIIL